MLINNAAALMEITGRAAAARGGSADVGQEGVLSILPVPASVVGVWMGSRPLGVKRHKLICHLCRQVFLCSVVHSTDPLWLPVLPLALSARLLSDISLQLCVAHVSPRLQCCTSLVL